MTTREALAKLNALEEAVYPLRHALSILYVDGDTAAPKESWRGRSRAVGGLAGMLHRLLVNEENREVFQTLIADPEGAGPLAVRRAELLLEDLDDAGLLTAEENEEYTRLTTEASAVWHEAKLKSDYAAFAPYLKRIIGSRREFARRKDASRPAYDVLLDTYEKGACQANLDPFFDLLRRELTPVILAVKDAPAPRMDFLRQSFPVDAQREFTRRLMQLMGLPADRCTVGETEHPFTDGTNRWDVRITTHYHEDSVLSSMFSVIHEGGHALYELGVAEELQFTCLAGGATMGLHESQSRFYENLIGRSLPFCRAVLPAMQACFPEQMRGVDAETLWRAANFSAPTLIRTEADELTYPMHVMIRYEIEKRMIAGDAQVEDLPGMWAQLYREYLGVEVPDHRRGILQDSHWSTGYLGYFPSYALGSAYGVQMLAALQAEFDPWPAVEQGDLSGITAWLGERIHRHGRLLKPAELLKSAGVDPFDPHCYVDYLKTKFRGLYGV